MQPPLCVMNICPFVLLLLTSSLTGFFFGSPHGNPHSDPIVDIVQKEPALLQATDAMCRHCFDVLIDRLQGKSNATRGWKLFSRGNAIPDFAKDLPDPSIECPLFITWDKSRPKRFPNNLLLHGKTDHERIFELRGCIGTLNPKPVLSSIGEYALTSALRDRRFQPMSVQEISQLRVAVSLLVNYEPCNHCLDWEVGTHGILIKFWNDPTAREYSATYLPEVAQEQGWNQRQAVTALVRKTGYSGSIDQALLDSIQCTRYQSSKKRLTYEEYVQYQHQLESGGTAITTTTATSTPPSTEPSSASSSFYQQQDMVVEVPQPNDPRKWNTCNNL